ncbi:MAG: nuclear transport factor 2 family protein [Chloroflexales bacterium]|nr:nuclear transport factor 2 family protein [Chloroflexales bacterium]
MPITVFYRFVVTFAGAATPDDSPVGYSDRVYSIVEPPQQRWTIAEDEQTVALTDAQHERLVRLLAALEPPPNPTIAPMVPGSDGTWRTVIIRHGDQQTAYRWWGSPPTAWAALDAICQYVQQLADIPREQVAQRQRQITRQFFDRLAARDLPGMQALYHPDIQYRNPLLALHGAQVAALWRMWWRDLPDVRVVCTDSGIRSGGAYWDAVYTYPPTGRRVEQHLTADLTFADGAIIQHVDRFNVHEWAGQAYGAVGGVIGGWRLFKWRLAAHARARLALLEREQQR